VDYSRRTLPIDLKAYKKKVILRTLRRCLLTALALAAPGIIMGLFRPALFLWALPAAIPHLSGGKAL